MMSADDKVERDSRSANQMRQRSLHDAPLPTHHEFATYIMSVRHGDFHFILSALRVLVVDFIIDSNSSLYYSHSILI